MEFHPCRWTFLGCAIVLILNCGQGFAAVTEPTTPSALERKLCGNETHRSYCHNGCCLDENKQEECCHVMQVSDWCPLINGSDLYCKWGCCYHDRNEICCNFWTMEYSFLLIVFAIVVAFLVFAVVVTCISNCISCSFFEPSYSKTF